MASGPDRTSADAAQLSLFGATEAVVYRESRRARRLGLRVFPHGVVEVVVPPRTGRRRIEAFLASHRAWIEEARRTMLEVHGPHSLDPPGDLQLRAVEETWRVSYGAGPRRLSEAPAAGGGVLRLSGPADDQWRRDRLRRWLRVRAKAVLVPWMEAVSRELELPFSSVSIRRQRSRWGSCSADGRISLNCALLFLDPALVRQVCVHELCHTRHLNHSPAFWRLVRRHAPDFRDREAALNQAWRDVPAWVTYDPPA
ncbi:MAG: SprT family zinc-dependent metalloprotease [Gammaproteobacteria bacterium]